MTVQFLLYRDETPTSIYHSADRCCSWKHSRNEPMGFCSVTLTLILNPYWIFRSTQRLFVPVDRKFPKTAVKNSSYENLNSETFQKKRI
ncbi:unnamed protein product [Caretta caretta]